MARQPVRSVRIDDALWALVGERAAAEGLTVSAWIVAALESHLGGMPHAGPPAPSPRPKGDQAATRRGPTTVAPARPAAAARELKTAGIAERAMESSGVTFGNVKGPMQKGGAEPKPGAARPSGRR